MTHARTHATFHASLHASLHCGIGGKSLAVLVWGLACCLPVTELRAESAFERAEDAVLQGRLSRAVDRYAEALSALLAADVSADARHAAGAEASLALRRLYRHSLSTGRAADALPTLSAWAQGAPGVDPALSSLARYYAGWTEFAATGDRSRADAHWNQLGYLVAWKIIGPFDNERGGGFETRYGPEKGIEFTSTFDGKVRPVTWRELPATPRSGRIDLDKILLPSDESLAYAVTFVRSERAQVLALRVASDEGFRAWVNGKLIVSEDRSRTQSFDQTAAALPLDAGWNIVLVKVTEEKGAWEFTARITALDGTAASAWSEGEPDGATLERAKSLEAGTELIASDAQVSRGPIDALRARIAKSPEDARAHYLLGALLRQVRAHDKSEHPDSDALRRAIEIDDKPAAYHVELAKSFRQQSTIAAQRDDNDWRHALEAAETRGALSASIALAEYYHSTFSNHRRAGQILDRVLEQNPDDVSAILLRGQIDEAKGFPDAWRQAVTRATRAAPASFSAMKVLARSLESEGRHHEQVRLLTAILERHHLDVDARWNLVDTLLTIGKRKQAHRVLSAYLDQAPFSTNVEERLATLALGSDDAAEAIRHLTEALRKRPEDHKLLDRLARAHFELDNGDRAIALWERALEIQPNQPELRERVEFLQKTESRFEDEWQRDAEKIARAAQKETYDNADGDAARVLLELAAVEVNRDGTAREYSQEVIQILNEAGVREFSRSRTPFADGEQIVEYRSATVYRADGTSEESRLRRYGSLGRSSTSSGTTWRYATQDLPALNVGDVVEVSFVKEDVRQSFFGDYYGRREILRGPLPTVEREFVLRVPSDRKFYFHERHIDAKPTVARDDEDETTTYTWKLVGLPRLQQEPAMPPGKEILPLVEISTFKDWNAFNSWYWNLIKKQFETSPEIDKKVAELVSGKDSEAAKIRAIYNFVVTDIRYNAWEFGVHGFKPYNASKVFARRFGDCKDKATLMSVMMDRVGIEAHPVLIYADQRRGSEDLSLPMVNHFNHCITYVPAKGDRPELYLDGTASFHSTEELPSMDRGAEVLIVREKGALVQQIPWNQSTDLSVDEDWRVTLGADRSARIELGMRARGDFAVYIRSNFEIAAQRVETLTKTLSTRFAGVELVEQKFSDLSNLDEPVTMSLVFTVPNFATMSPEGWTLAVPDDFFGSTRGVGILSVLESRETDLVLGNPRRSSVRVEVSLPEGVAIKSLPESFDEKTTYGRLRLDVGKTAKGRLRLEKIVELTKSRVPQAEYAKFREFAAKVDLIAKEKIVLEN